jgi:hypothetical protein
MVENKPPLLTHKLRRQGQTDLPDRPQQHVNQTSTNHITQAAQYLKINYSSAKFIFSQYRNRNQQCHIPETGKGCSYEVVKLDEN